MTTTTPAPKSFTLFYHSPAGVKDWTRFTPLPDGKTVRIEVDHRLPDGRVWSCELPIDRARQLYGEKLKKGHVRVA